MSDDVLTIKDKQNRPQTRRKLGASIGIGATLTSVLLAGCSMLAGAQFGKVPDVGTAARAGLNAGGAVAAVSMTAPGADRIERIHTSPNYNDGAFRNLVNLPKPGSTGSIWAALYDWFAGRAERAPSGEMPVAQLENLRMGDGLTHVTWMGHSTVLIEIDGKLVMTDPVFSDHASPYAWLPPKSFYKTMPVSLDDIDFIDVVLISHDHYDHLDHKTMTALAKKVGQFVVPLGVGSHLQHWGIDEERTTELDWWQNTTIATLTLTATPAQHFSGRTLSGGNETLWAGWAIKGRSENIFFSGDTAYFPGFKDIGEKLGPFDLTLIECGAYNEAWSNVHMFPEQTAKAHRDLKGKVLLPIHWGRFDLALHPWTEPVERLNVAAKTAGINVTQPRIGERFALNGNLPQTAWWRGAEGKQTARATAGPVAENALDRAEAAVRGGFRSQTLGHLAP
jgi:L-ascorbate metabolism protein UlaG (beta-lactamase superfamily)